MTRSKVYKGVRDFSVVATLKGDTVFVKIKLSKWEVDISPVKIPVSEWLERRSANQRYDKWEYLDSRYNKGAHPHTARVLDQVRKAVDEVTNDAVVQEKSGKPKPPGFRVFK